MRMRLNEFIFCLIDRRSICIYRDDQSGVHHILAKLKVNLPFPKRFRTSQKFGLFGGQFASHGSCSVCPLDVVGSDHVLMHGSEDSGDVLSNVLNFSQTGSAAGAFVISQFSELLFSLIKVLA